MEETVQDVLKEMRERRVSHGKAVSPTLIGWADRIEAAMGVGDGEPKIWGTQKPGMMPRLFGAHCFAELNWYPDEGGDLVCMQVIERITAQQAKGECDV